MVDDKNKSKVAIITGASEGIGQAISLALLKEGYRVVMVSRSAEKLQQALSNAGERSDQAWLYPADLTVSEQVNQMVETVLLHEKRIDVLINNLGQGIQRQLVDTTDQEWDYMVSVNLTSAFYACRAVIPILRFQKAGTIVNISSRAGRRGEGDFAAYSALKHGLIGLTRALAESESPRGIRVNAICPGAVSTMKMTKRHPISGLSRWSTPDDVANTVLFLLSKPAETMNGQTIDLFRK